MKILQVADRPGWAIDRLSKPLSELYPEVDMSYFSVSAHRYLDSGYSDWKTSTQFTQELAEQYDVIHFHRVKACLFDFNKMRAKKVITVHTERHEDWEDKRLMDFDLIIAPTKHAMEHCLKVIPELKDKIVHIPHGIDTKKYIHIPERKPQKGEIGYVGRVVKWKRFSSAQKGANLTGLKLIACGYIESGKDYNIYNLREDVDFEYHPFLNEPLMTEFYHRMNLFLSLSISHVEAGPLPTLEAMACGVPVISTKVGWAKDYCTHNKNIVFIEQDVAEDPIRLSKIIKEVYEDETYKEQISQGALELIKDFSIEKYAEKLMKLYEQK